MFQFFSVDVAVDVVVDLAVVGVCFGGVALAVVALDLGVVALGVVVEVVEVEDSFVRRSSISVDVETSSTKLLPILGVTPYVAAAAASAWVLDAV